MQFVSVVCCVAEVSTAEEEGVYSGMLIRKHQWESTTKKASNRLVICKYLVMCFSLFNSLPSGVVCQHDVARFSGL